MIEKFEEDIFEISLIKMDENMFKLFLNKTNFYKDFKNTVDMILDKLYAINNFLGNIRERDKISPDRDYTKKSYIKEYEKARKFNLYICLDKKMKFLSLLDYEEFEWETVWNSFFEMKKKK